MRYIWHADMLYIWHADMLYIWHVDTLYIRHVDMLYICYVDMLLSILVFAVVEQERTQISGKFSLSNCQSSSLGCEGFTLNNFTNFEIFVPEKLNNLYYIFSDCFWFPWSFQFYFMEVRDKNELGLNFSESLYENINHHNIRRFPAIKLGIIFL